MYSVHVACQLKQKNTWPNVPNAKSGITSPVNIFLMQYLEIQIVTGNVACVSKDEPINVQYESYKSVFFTLKLMLPPCI